MKVFQGKRLIDKCGEVCGGRGKRFTHEIKECGGGLVGNGENVKIWGECVTAG